MDDELQGLLDALGQDRRKNDHLEMIIFCLTVHHLWGRTLNKHNQDACAVAYADDGYIKAKLSITLEVLSRLGHQAFTQGGRWPRSQFRQDQDSRQGYLGG